ncbi:MAG: hypothetical protein ACP5HK_00550 [Acidilobus sp.]
MSAEEERSEEAEGNGEATEGSTEEKTESEVEAVAAEYRLGSPELIEVMLNAFDVLEQASEGRISIDQAKALMFENVDEALKKAGEAVRKRARRRPAKKTEKKSQRRKKAAKSSKKKAAS